MGHKRYKTQNTPRSRPTKPETQSRPEPQPTDWIDIIINAPQRAAIPVLEGTFQAVLPDFSKDKPYEYENDLDSLKWIGKQIWPRPKNEGNPIPNNGLIKDEIGKGRPEICSCQVPGSVECVNLHVNEEKIRLQSDLGPAFRFWRFDQMRDDDSDSWTLKDMIKFIWAVNKKQKKKKKEEDDDKNASSEEDTNAEEEEEGEENASLKVRTKGFLELAKEWLPLKTKESIMSYYFNFYVPWRIRNQIRSGRNQFEIDTDEDEAEETGQKWLKLSSNPTK